MRKDKKDITTDITEIHQIIRDYSEHSYANKIENLEEWLNSQKNTTYQDLITQIEHMNRPIMNKDNESIIKKTTKK